MNHRVRIVVVGDGPAGSALAAELVDRCGGDEVLLVGLDEPWTPTYGAWRDDLADLAGRAGGLGDDLTASEVPSVRVATRSDPTDDRTIDRGYCVVANDALRNALRSGVVHRRGLVTGVDPGPSGRRAVVVDGDRILADLVVDATGWPPGLAGSDSGEVMAWQTAWGVVLPEPPPGPLGRPTVMDWTPPGGRDHRVPTFAYALPVAHGWLVEETVLASSPAVAPEELRPVLARRLGVSADRLDTVAVGIERVHIPMGAPMPGRRTRRSGTADGSVLPFGAAAAMAHPATGYQLVPALRSAPQVATVVAEALAAGADPEELGRSTADAVWPVSQRRTRRLHEFGLDVLLRLDSESTRSFFETFFDLPDHVWPAQMRIDSPPARIAAVMSRMFAAAPWALRRQLLGGDLARLVRVVRP